MLLPNVRRVVQVLREKTRLIRLNNKKVEEWVDQYINRQALRGEAVTILTQWCLAKDLEVRFKTQNEFTPTKAEQVLFEKELPAIAELFQQNGIALNWILTFNRSYLDLGRIDAAVEQAYVQMILELATPLRTAGWLQCLNWEDDLLGSRPEPDAEVFDDTKRFVSEGALRIDIERHRPWVIESGLQQTEKELERDVRFKIACEVREGFMIIDPEWYFGECIIIPLETPERYDFFGLKAPRIKQQVVSALPPYPWRI